MTIVKKAQHDRHMYRWTAEGSDIPITRDMAEEYQAEAGYSPLGYGFYEFKAWRVVAADETTTTTFAASWLSSTSCD